MIHYKIIPKKKPGDPNAPVKYYASAVNQGRIDIEGLAENLDESTVGLSDSIAVAYGMSKAILRSLRDGKNVTFNKIGSFYITLKSNGSETEAQVSETNIKGARIVFRPSPELKAMLKTLSYKKA